MKSKWLFLLLWMCVIVRPEAWGQEVKSANTVAEEWIQVSSSSATVLQWFEWIEKSTGIVLSYNPAQMELGDVCRIEHGGKMTVETLVRRILSGYQVKIAVVPPRKLVIHARKIESYDVSGTVSEEDSEERLYGAVVTLEDKDGKQWNTISNGKGIFRLHVPEGTYTLKTSYMGYAPQSQSVRVTRDCFVRTRLKPLLFEIEEVTVESGKRENELGELTPSNLLAFSGGDLFSQIWILPGVTSSLAGQNFMVDGGGYDENQLLLDGVPVFHPGHFSSLLPVFNGDAVKNMVFHKGFFPTPLEGRISSVTEVNLKEGNKKEHVRTLTLDMPAASVMLEGPIIKNKLSYMVGARRSWLDFFDSLLSEENRLNHSTYDYNAKLSYNFSPVTTLNFLAYGAPDDYHLPLQENGENVSVLRWDNQAYQLSFATQKGRLGNSTAVFYSAHTNRAYMGEIKEDTDGYVHSGIKSLNVATDFSYSLENLYHARWGVKYAYEVYDLVSQGEEMRVRHEPVNQVSVYYDNLLRISPEFSVQVGVHGVAYCPQHHRSYYSIQPRLSVKYFPSERNLLYLNFSKMEQFYHFLRFDSFSLPTDFRMPSIDGFKPRSSEHYEMGWKHFMDSGQCEVSVYYKTRRNVLALRPDTWVEDEGWQKYLMVGNGDSYGVKGYLYQRWNRWSLQLSYAYSRSREWFGELPEKGKVPSLYDVPHQLGGALSYQLTTHSSFSVGGMLRSGKVRFLNEDYEPLPVEDFREKREPLNYRVDVGYSYRKSFGEKLLLLRLGVYNVVGNPSEEDILSFIPCTGEEIVCRTEASASNFKEELLRYSLFFVRIFKRDCLFLQHLLMRQ